MMMSWLVGEIRVGLSLIGWYIVQMECTDIGQIGIWFGNLLAFFAFLFSPNTTTIPRIPLPLLHNMITLGCHVADHQHSTTSSFHPSLVNKSIPDNTAVVPCPQAARPARKRLTRAWDPPAGPVLWFGRCPPLRPPPARRTKWTWPWVPFFYNSLLITPSIT